MTQEEKEAKIAQLEQEISDLKGTNEESVTTSSQKEPKKKEDRTPESEQDAIVDALLKDMTVPPDAKLGDSAPCMRGSRSKGIY